MQNLDEFTITPEALRRLERTPSARLKLVLDSLVRHLHDFAREVRLTETEWLAGIEYLTRTGQLCGANRQEFVLLSDTLGLSQLVVAQNHRRESSATEQTVLGPFHVEGAPSLPSHGADIAGDTAGPLLYVSGRVTSTGTPVVGALVDVWHADSEGHYDIQTEDWRPERARLRGTLVADSGGCFSFRSILPKSYPIPTDGTVGEMLRATQRSAMRPAHLHFIVRKPGFDGLVTHVFVEGDPYLDSDAVFGVRSSCIGHYVKHTAGLAPDGRRVAEAFYTLDYTFALHAQE